MAAADQTYEKIKHFCLLSTFFRVFVMFAENNEGMTG
jgi:hypothetical protein